jgi:hypothetical protein
MDYVTNHKQEILLFTKMTRRFYVQLPIITPHYYEKHLLLLCMVIALLFLTRIFNSRLVDCTPRAPNPQVHSHDHIANKAADRAEAFFVPGS